MTYDVSARKIFYSFECSGVLCYREMNSYIDFHLKTQVKTMAQRPVQQVPQQPSDEDNDEDDLANSAVSGKATIGLGGRARPSSSPLVICL